jgi:GTPase SAR1 family protein
VTATDTPAAAARVRDLATEAMMRTADPLAREAVATIVERLDGPLRVAIAGRVKAGKSTLLNALVGERLAPTDAGECTLVVSWYHEGLSYDVQAILRDGRTESIPFTRREGALEMDLGRLDPSQVERLDVAWPSAALRQLTLIDTPGLASLRDENSLRTREFLAMGEDRPSDADAVIYLMRHLHRKDAEFLGAFLDRGVSTTSPVNAVAVLSRADEIGAGRLDALASAGRIASRLGNDRELRGLCAAVIPVAGLLAETGATWREQEAAAIRTLASTPAEELELMLLSADHFVEPSVSALTVELRRDLLDRLGMFGVRYLLAELAAGRVANAGDMARALLAVSGLDELRRFVRDHFQPRAQVLKARSALASLRTVARRLAGTEAPTADWLEREVERLEAATQEFALLRLGHLVATGLVRFAPDEVTEVERVVDGGAIEGAPIEGIERWRTRGSDPLADPATAEAAETMARVYEAAYLRQRG